MCHNECVANSDCGSTSMCCSEGFCADEKICYGNKVKGDYCDANTECMTVFCKNTECTEEEVFLKSNNIMIIIVIVIIIILFCATCSYYSYKDRTKSVLGIRNGSRSGSGDSKSRNNDALNPFTIGDQAYKKGTISSDSSLLSNSSAKKKFSFSHLVKRGRVSLRLDQRYVATPIYEQSDD
jgi:hypothetical protein